MYYKNLSISLVCNTGHRFMTSTPSKLSSMSMKELLKNIVKPENIPLEYWTRVILVAKELKESLYKNNKKSLKLLNTKHITLLFARPHGRFQLAFTLACDLLGARRTLYQDRNFENQPNPADSGKVLSALTDMFVIHGLHHDILIKMVTSVSVPVFSASSDAHCLQKALSDLMTFHERLNRLNGLTLAWIGPPCSLFNSYMVLCAKFGINVQYTLICSKTFAFENKYTQPKTTKLQSAPFRFEKSHSVEKPLSLLPLMHTTVNEFGSGRMSPVRRFQRKSEESENSRIDSKEFKSVTETVKGAHIIATSMHPDEGSRITPELLKNADPNHVFMHSLPRSWNEVSDEVFNQENNLSWQTSENYLYIAMAFILTSLSNYEPKSKVSVL